MTATTAATAAAVILVGCTKSKRSTRSIARDLYDPSDLFRRRRAYAEAAGRPWAILSALYGVVEPGQTIDPYDLTIGQRSRPDADPRGWAIGSIQSCYRLAGRVTDVGLADCSAPLTIEVHAGIDYVRTLELALPAFAAEITIEHPVRGMMIGEQKAHYFPPAPAVELPALGQLHLAI